MYLPEADKLKVMMAEAYSRQFIADTVYNPDDYVFVPHRNSAGDLIAGEWRSKAEIQQEDRERGQRYKAQTIIDNPADAYFHDIEELLERSKTGEELSSTQIDKLENFKSSVEINTHADYYRARGETIKYAGTNEDDPRYEELHEQLQELYQDNYGDLPAEPPTLQADSAAAGLKGA